MVDFAKHLAKNQNRLILLDGMNLTRRFYHGMANHPELAFNKDGKPVGVIVGWVNACLRLREAYKPARLIAVFEEGRCQHRINIHPEYKAHREERPVEFDEQIPTVMEWTRALGITTMSHRGHEADDVIAHLVVEWLERDENAHAFVASSDKDYHALLTNKRVHMLKPGQGTSEWIEVRHGDVLEKFGILPHQFVDYLALTGDKSDGYGGVPGVGPKTASQLIRDFGSCQRILEAIGSGRIRPERLNDMLHANEEIIRRNLELVNFVHVPDVRLDPPRPGQYGRCLEILRELGLAQQIGKVIDAKDTWFPDAD